MSNLGKYQWMTTVAKKVGGPINLLLLAGTTGAVVYKGGEIAVKQCVRKIKAHNTVNPTMETNARLYNVTSAGRSNEGLEFIKGDQFRVLESDGASVLVEKIGDTNNPYFVSADVLRNISNYNE